MAAFRNIQLVQHRGEYLVAAELCRQGYLATTFTGNVPEFDIIAVDAELEARPVQVKAKRGATWQFNASAFLDIDYDKKRGTQQVRKKRLKHPDLKFVLVDLSTELEPEFYVIDMKKLRDIIHRRYSKYLEQHGGRRPRAAESTHTVVRKEQVKRYRDNWESIFE